MADPLDDCALKLNRALDHLETLKNSIEGFRKSKPHNLTHTFDSEGEGKYLATETAELVKPRPPEWPVLIGEFLYHCDSALDHVMWKLATRKRHGVEPPAGIRITFPKEKNRSRFWRKDTRTGRFRAGSAARRLLWVPGDARKLILELQPYTRGDKSPEHPLWLLHDLANEDKHKAIHVASSVVVAKRLESQEFQDLRLDSFDTRPEPFDKRADIAWLRFSRTGAKPKLKAVPSFRIEEAFAGGGSANGHLVWDTLMDIQNFLVIDVFRDRFAPYFNSTLFPELPPDPPA